MQRDSQSTREASPDQDRKRVIREAHSRALAAQQRGDLKQAQALLQQILAREPEHPASLHLLGLILRQNGDGEGALRWLKQAAELRPRNASFQFNLGRVLQEQGRLEEALARFRLVIALQPDHAYAHTRLCAVLAWLGRLAEAEEACLRVQKLRPEVAATWRLLGDLRLEQGRPDAAVEAYAAAMDREPNDLFKVHTAVMMPEIQPSAEAAEAAWRRAETELAALASRQLQIPNPLAMGRMSSFYLSYQDVATRDLKVQLARIHRRASPILDFVAPHCLASSPPRPGARLRLGLVSRHLHNHTVGRVTQGLISGLGRDRFEVVVFLLEPPFDDVSRNISKHADRTVFLPSDDLRAAQRRVAAEELDLLLYPDIGMEPFTYFLAFARLAPVQCTTWGHVDTTGIDTVDYYVSSAYMEPEGAEAHYSETLVRLNSLLSAYPKPTLPATLPLRSNFGLDAQEHIYLCPQSLFKLHPGLDPLLAAILRRDPMGRLVLPAGTRPGWSERLMARFHQTMADVVDRVSIVPRQRARDYFGLLAAADVILDPMPFGGGSTSYEALTVGRPIVTMPGQFLRGRMTYGLYKRMGVLDCIAESKPAYVDLAVRLGTDTTFRGAVEAKIRANNEFLFNDIEVVKEFERFFLEATARIRSQSQSA